MNSIYFYYEIQSTDPMTEGTVPVPTTAPALIAIISYYLFRSYRIDGAKAAGVNLRERSGFFKNISPEPEKFRDLFYNSVEE